MGDLSTLGRVLILAGVAIAAIGLLALLGGRLGLPLGRLPGDLRFQSGGATCLVPLGTSIVLSLVLTLVLNLVVRLLNR
jgi:hypothetical protein